MEFEENRRNGFRGEVIQRCELTDGQTTDGRRKITSDQGKILS